MRKQGQGELAVLSYNGTVRHLLKLQWAQVFKTSGTLFFLILCFKWHHNFVPAAKSCLN